MKHKLFTPFRSNAPRQHVHISDISKEQLAKACNEQAATITRLDHHVKTMARILCAITLEPEAFHYTDGIVSIDVTALKKVLEGTQLHCDQADRGLVLRATPPQEWPRVEIPNILMPGTVQ